MSSVASQRMIRRAAREIRAGLTVNLGIGLPTRVIDEVDDGLPVCLHSENGIAGVGPSVAYTDADRNLIDAGGMYVSRLPGTAFFDSADSFALVRGGRLDLSILGAFEVAMNGDLANWVIPGLFTPGVGGAMELAQKARRVVVMMSHCDRRGRPKILRECSLPITAAGCVDRIYTDLAVIDIEDGRLLLREIAADSTVDAVVAATAAPLQLADGKIASF